jgi:hypothetical protein
VTLRISLLYSENVLKPGIEGSWILKIFKNPDPDCYNNVKELSKKAPNLWFQILKYQLEANNCNRMMVNLVCKKFPYVHS